MEARAERPEHLVFPPVRVAAAGVREKRATKAWRLASIAADSRGQDPRDEGAHGTRHSAGERFSSSRAAYEEGTFLPKGPFAVHTPERIRTSDTWLRRPVLYPLSYGRIR